MIYSPYTIMMVKGLFNIDQTARGTVSILKQKVTGASLIVTQPSCYYQIMQKQKKKYQSHIALSKIPFAL